RLIETIANGVDRVEHPVAFRFVDRLPHEVGTRPRFLQQARLREARHRTLGGGGNEAGARAHENAAAENLRRGNVEHGELAAADGLNQLLHRWITCASGASCCIADLSSTNARHHISMQSSEKIVYAPSTWPLRSSLITRSTAAGPKSPR